MDSVPGSAGLGDPFFPGAGNGGYDVSKYSLTLSYDPATNHLTGTAAITARATQNRYGNVTTAQFIALSEQISGLDLERFFDVWVYQPDKPTS